jgi:two-component system, NarL family, invasion response regulator UvrY
MIHVILADDHGIVRAGVRRMLEAEEDFAVAGEAATGDDLLRVAAKVAWDVVVLDLSLPGPTSLDLIKKVKELRPRGRVAVLTMHPEDEYAIRLMQGGADGYVTKSADPQELVKALRVLDRGGKHVSPRLAALLLEARVGSGHGALTNRELEVLVRVGQGQTPSQIAGELDLAASTVSTHIGRIKEKLALDSLGSLVQYAVRNGLV